MSGDLTAPETFTNMVTADSIMKRMIPTTVLLFLISALLFSCSGAVGMPGIAGPMLALPFCALTGRRVVVA